MMDSGMFHTKKSIISEHFGFTEALLEDVNENSTHDSTGTDSQLHDLINRAEQIAEKHGIAYTIGSPCHDLTCGDTCTC
jgi:hypothetical protein